MSWLSPRKLSAEADEARPRRRRSADTIVLIDFLRRYGWIILVLILTALATFALEEYDRRAEILATMPPGFQYAGCDEARSHGVAPLYRGDPGYSASLDADGNGVACETAVTPGPG